jgi:hypothetical protein
LIRRRILSHFLRVHTSEGHLINFNYISNRIDQILESERQKEFSSLDEKNINSFRELLFSLFKTDNEFIDFLPDIIYPKIIQSNPTIMKSSL